MALTSQNTAMLKKFQYFREHGPGLDIDARILAFLGFFEHYRVSCDWGLEILEFFEHYSVSCTPCPMIHECVGVDLGRGGEHINIYIYIYISPKSKSVAA